MISIASIGVTGGQVVGVGAQAERKNVNKQRIKVNFR
jgi:hypothetical protein